MPTPVPAGFTLGALKPEDAVAAFAARKLLRPSFRWQDIWQAEHTAQFAVAGVMRLDILQLIREQLRVAVEQGQDLQSFTAALKTQLVAKGWWGNIEITDPSTGEVRKTRFNNQRLQLIFDVNTRQSYAAGRWARIQRGPMPYIVYRTMRDERVRVSHRPWDNVVLPKDHPWWDTHFPPCGWRCRCHAFAIDEAGLALLRNAAPKDSPVKTEPPPMQWVEYVNKSSGRTERVPRGIDPGFAYNPGKALLERGVDRLHTALAQVGPSQTDAGDALETVKAVVARMRSEKGFQEFLSSPPNKPVGMPVAALPALESEPSIAAVSGQQLLAQASGLPVIATDWALAQAIIDQGSRLVIADDHILWWQVRGSGNDRRVRVLELERSALVWWVRSLDTMTQADAIEAYPALGKVLA